ncbi:MAG: hypothetical protein LBL87_07695 [Ruminococcus sp.]|jgi:hypothetical protein|nr:hypothetical protein [Ruminococcus sp.]
MYLSEFTDKLDENFTIVNKSSNAAQTELSKVYCCDLLSFAMARNPAGSVWVTVMGNVNTMGVVTLTDGGCVILAENAALDAAAEKKAVEQDITVIKTRLPVFEAALAANKLLLNL